MLYLTIEVPTLLYQILIYGTAVLPQVHQFWNTIWGKLAHESPYTISIEGMRIRLPKLQDDDKKAKKLKSKELLESWEDIEEVLYYQGFLYIPKVIYSELISRYHINLFIGYFGMEKTRELIARKYY